MVHHQNLSELSASKLLIRRLLIRQLVRYIAILATKTPYIAQQTMVTLFVENRPQIQILTP